MKTYSMFILFICPLVYLVCFISHSYFESSGFVYIMSSLHLFLGSIPLRGYTTIHFFTHLLMCIWTISFWACHIHSMNTHVQIFVQTHAFFVLEKLPNFPNRWYHFPFPLPVYEGSSCSTSLPILGMDSLSNRCVVIFHCGLNLHFSNYVNIFL